MVNKMYGRKRFLAWIAAGSIATAVAFNVNLNTHGKYLSDFALANVEALAKNEGPSNPDYDCCGDGCIPILYQTAIIKFNINFVASIFFVLLQKI